MWTNEQKAEFVTRINVKRETYDKAPLSDQAILLEIGDLEHLPFADVVQAIRSHRDQYKPPNAASILAACEDGTDQLKDKAAQFWQKLVWMVSHGQSACAVQSEDWRAQVALREYWPAICTASVTSQKALDDLKYDVVRAYVQAGRENAVTGFTSSPIATGRQDLIMIHSDTTKAPQKITQNGNLLISQDQYAALTSETKLIGDSNE